MNSIPPFQFDAKLLLLAIRMQLEVTYVFALFGIVCINLIQKQNLMILVLTFDSKFTYLYIFE
jgi:hypothetical protein